MYASIRRYRGLDQKTTAEAVRLGMDLRRRISDRAGFVAYEVVITEDGFLTLNVFESELTALESNAVAAVWIREKIPELGLPAPEIVKGEIYEEAGSGRRPFTPPEPLRPAGPALASQGRGF